MELTKEQREELAEMGKHCTTPYLRDRARMVLAVANGHTRKAVAEIFLACPQTVGAVCRRYLQDGLEGLRMRPGRGRRSAVSKAQVEHYLRQSPRAFGIRRQRWTLRALAQTVPCFRGFTDSGVMRALQRLGYAYKRSQPHTHSPDPEYEEKKGLWTPR